MSTKNRGDRIQLLHKVVTKHFSPVAASEDRTVLEHLLYACCLEDTSYEAADEAFHRLQESFFDWNEVRVTTVSELRETLHNLPDPTAAAMRIKRCLQSLFETRYCFDLEDMIKMNQGKAVQELEKLSGMSRFVLAYVTQHALGGHSIPISDSIMQILLMTEIVSPAEAAKGQTPGLERTISKTKGVEFASCLHQLAVLHAHSPQGKQTKTILKEAGATEPKKAPPAPAAPKAAAKVTAKSETPEKSEKLEKSDKADKADKASKAEKASKSEATDKSGKGAKADAAENAQKGAASKTGPAKKVAASAKKTPSKKTPAKKIASKPAAAKKSAKHASSPAKNSKRKPR
jgi:endonuclease III